ncbi:MAG: response regulator transcription factor [Ruminococcus sp.]|nr:response regulator transcription factor [Ruminococcus sp.]
MPNILIIDDDAHINDIVSKALQSEGYSVSSAYSGTEALLLLSQSKPDLVLLDLMLPGLSGEELLPQIKDIPVIVVSAKTDVTDKVELLIGGAVDYITKPFHMEELLARIMVQLRKNERYAERSLLAYREITLDTDKHTLFANGKEQKLTRTEYAILKLLMQNPEQVVAKLTILDRISLDTPDCTEDSLKSHIYNLRKKLKALTGKEYISAVWGIGFMLNEKS